MIFHEENGNPLAINSIHDKVPTNYLWCLDLKSQDFTINMFKVVEECKCNTLTVKINNRYIELPSYWYILVCDPETTQIDTVQVCHLSNNTFYALVYGASAGTHEYMRIDVIAWKPEGIHVYPTHSRGVMLCLDIGDGKWISCSFSDTYTRFLKHKNVGDLIGY